MTSASVDLARRLIEIDSTNPALIPGAAGETAIADFVAHWLSEHGFTVSRIGRNADRPTIVGIAKGSGGGKSLMLNGHLDTVGTATYRGDGLAPEVRDGRLYGRGAFDMKGGVAAILVGAARAVEAGVSGDVIVTLVADEEFGSQGTEDALALYTADAAIVAEPSGLELTVAHRGFAWFQLEITGLAAHGSMPEQGVDAIAHAARVLRALDTLRVRLESRPAHPYVGHGTVRVSTITGGVDAATVAPSCTLTIERRFLPGESVDHVEAELRESLGGLLGQHDSGATAILRQIVARGAFEAHPESAIVAEVATASRDVLGSEPARRGEPFWTDAGLIAEAGIPCVIIGVDGGGAHADEEWATTRSIEQLAQIIECTTVAFCE